MALEIRELIVKVNVNENPQQKAEISPVEMKRIVDECTKKVFKELKMKRKR